MDIETTQETEEDPIQEGQSENEQEAMPEAVSEAVSEQTLPDDQSPTLPEQIELAVNGEKRQYSIADLQKLASAGDGFNDLNQQKQQWEQEKQAWEQHKKTVIAQAQQQTEQELKEEYIRTLPDMINRNYEREKQLENMSDVERQIFTQNEQIATLKREHEESQKLMQEKEAEMQRQQQERELENARQFYNAFFTKQGVDNNEYIKNSFMTGVATMQELGATDFDMEELLKIAKENYNKQITNELTKREPQDLIAMLGEQRLAEIQNYLVSKQQNKNKTASAAPSRPDQQQDDDEEDYMNELY